MPIFEQRTALPFSTHQLYRYHINPGAFERLTPPWEKVEVAEPDSGINEGHVRHLKIGPWPVSISWKAIHEEFVEGAQFVDRQLQGPFKEWRHQHLFEKTEDRRSVLHDRIHFQAPFGLPIGPLVRRKLGPMFHYRHRQTERDLALLSAYPGPLGAPRTRGLKIGITGATGFVGRRLTSLLQVGGHRVIRLRRGHQAEGENEAVWWPEPDLASLEGLDAVIHLAGEPIAQPWTESARERIFYSRVEGTKRLSRALADLKKPPKVLISTSATGYYEQQSQEPVDESAPPCDHFLSVVCQAWEGATEPAENAGIRVCHVRVGLVLEPSGGVLGLQLPAFRLGLGAVLGDGRQMQPFVDQDDLVGAFYHLLQNEDLRGPFNATAPHPVTQKEFAETLASMLGRPLWMKIPESPARTVLKDQADLFFSGVAALPNRLQETGYQFLAPTLRECFAHHLGITNHH